MIRSTFRHLPGVGPGKEARLWQEGCLTWDDALARGRLSCRGGGGAAAHLEESKARHEAGDAQWFGERLAPAEQWRLFSAYRHSVAYVDIETTGMAWPMAHITSIALYDGVTVRTYVHGENLEAFADDILPYRLLVTFNGRSFDAPFIERSFGIRLRMAHLDLRPVLRAAGYTGGLKRIEHSLGMGRGDLEGVDGFTAVLLWQHYERTGDVRALETLLAYNVEDVLSLEQLAVFAYNRHLAELPPPAGRYAAAVRVRTQSVERTSRSACPSDEMTCIHAGVCTVRAMCAGAASGCGAAEVHSRAGRRVQPHSPAT